MKTLLCSYFLAWCALSAAAQPKTHIVSGMVLENNSRTPVPYASIHDISGGKTILTNDSGYFSLALPEGHDSLLVSFVGLQPKRLRANGFETVYLEENVLEDVVVETAENPYLYRLLASCKKKAGTASAVSKAYYQLKTRRDDRQIELVECFYNANVTGPDLASLDLKAGRVALDTAGTQSLTSLESSGALVMLRMFDGDRYYPESPMELHAKSMQQHYRLRLVKKYKDDRGDSVYQVACSPRGDTGRSFRCTLWLNPATLQLLKQELVCSKCSVHPFIALHHDTLTELSLRITKTFRQWRGRTMPDHIDLSYSYRYTTGRARAEQHSYRATTDVVLHLFDYEEPYFIPAGVAGNSWMSDYRQISAIPYNDFFWTHNKSYRIDNAQRENERFFREHERLFTGAERSGQSGVFVWRGQERRQTSWNLESPFVSWSPARVLFEGLWDTARKPGGLPANYYNLGVYLVLDLNRDGDSTDILTAAVINPFETYYNLPVTEPTQCFLNIYFDLYEVSRRRLVAALKQTRTAAEAREAYREAMDSATKMRNRFLRETRRGENVQLLKAWSDIVYAELGIDNWKLFGFAARTAAGEHDLRAPKGSGFE